jgi:hypothetical protein
MFDYLNCSEASWAISLKLHANLFSFEKKVENILLSKYNISIIVKAGLWRGIQYKIMKYN